MENHVYNPMEDCARVLLSEKEIEAIVDRLAGEIEATYRNCDRRLVMVVILKGSMLFASDLAKRINLPLEIEFMKVSSYGAGTVSTGCINLHLDLKRKDYEKLDLLLIEDIVDSGRTLSMLTALFRERNAHTVRCCTMLDKPEGRVVDLQADYVCFTVPNAFVVGMGLDYNDYYRNLPFVGVLKPQVYKD